MLSTFLLSAAQKHFDAGKAEVANLKTPADVRQRQQILKARMIAALGGFPKKTPLKRQVVGKERRDGYRIEKRPLTIHAADPKGEAITQAALEKAYANCRKAWETGRAASRLVLNAGK